MKSSEIIQHTLKLIGSDSKWGDSNIDVAPLPGDASTRRYYRVSDKNSPPSKYVLMSTDAFSADENNFLLVQNLLQRNGIPVPEVKAVADSSGAILLSDLGDSTMLHRLEASMEEDLELSMFRKAIDLMVQIHGVQPDGTEPIGLKSFEKSFNEEILMWEVNFTIEHFLQNYLGRDLPKSDLEGIREAFSDICKRLAREPKVFTHRDYHTRNIMVADDGKYYSIDFQDARMGPRQYDLASLLRDSYYQMREQKVYHLLKYYYNTASRKQQDLSSEKEFISIFDLMSIQRNFKAIGSFASFYIRRDNAKYLRFIGNTFENIRRNLVKFPEYKELHQLLFNWYYF